MEVVWSRQKWTGKLKSRWPFKAHISHRVILLKTAVRVQSTVVCLSHWIILSSLLTLFQVSVPVPEYCLLLAWFQRPCWHIYYVYAVDVHVHFISTKQDANQRRLPPPNLSSSAIKLRCQWQSDDQNQSIWIRSLLVRVLSFLFFASYQPGTGNDTFRHIFTEPLFTTKCARNTEISKNFLLRTFSCLRLLHTIKLSSSNTVLLPDRLAKKKMMNKWPSVYRPGKNEFSTR